MINQNNDYQSYLKNNKEIVITKLILLKSQKNIQVSERIYQL